MKQRKPLIAVVPFGISKDCCGHAMRLVATEAAGDKVRLVLIADREAAVRGQIATGEVAAVQPISTIQEAHKATGVTQLTTNSVMRRNPLTGLDQIDLAATVVASLQHALELARDGAIDALVILGDPSRPGDRLAIMPDGLLRWMAQAWRQDPSQPLPTLGDIHAIGSFWHLSVLEPMPLMDVPAHLSPLHIEKALDLLHKGLGDAGFDKPNIAIASLNPRRLGGRYHGTEEASLMAELIARRQQAGQRVFGPWPLDEILSDARDGALDGVVTLHTEQARVVRTFMRMERAPQIIAGLSVPCVRAVWERQPGLRADKAAEFAEAAQALNMAKMLCATGRPAFRFRGEDRVGSTPQPKGPPR